MEFTKDGQAPLLQTDASQETSERAALRFKVSRAVSHDIQFTLTRRLSQMTEL
ncbi:hypothetical protein J3D46_004846 [Paenarthrobacter sp. A20]|nr:hypothetical protein [Paenarthrobacter sp. A20]